jgi:REP element-mobilizing transposase RayT
MAKRKPKRMDLPATAGWGGARTSSGRKRRTPGGGPSHVARIDHDSRNPVHVTLRAHTTVPSLRAEPTFSVLKRALGASNRLPFRVIHFSVQLDHVHLIVEADSQIALTRGLQGLAIRCARAINRVTRHRGPVWRHRYHARELKTPSEVRRAMAYVLLNFRKHLHAAPGIDPRSSGVWFDQWNQPVAPSAWPRLVATPRTCLAAIGWRHAGGALDVSEMPSRRARR